MSRAVPFNGISDWSRTMTKFSYCERVPLSRGWFKIDDDKNVQFKWLQHSKRALLFHFFKQLINTTRGHVCGGLVRGICQHDVQYFTRKTDYAGVRTLHYIVTTVTMKYISILVHQIFNLTGECFMTPYGVFIQIRR